MFLIVVLFFLFPIRANATSYTRSSGLVTITAPKSRVISGMLKRMNDGKR